MLELKANVKECLKQDGKTVGIYSYWEESEELVVEISVALI